MDELRPIDSLVVHLSTSRYHFEGVPGNAAPLLVTLVILSLEKVMVNVSTNFCTQSTDIVGGDSRVPVEYLYWYIPGQKWLAFCATYSPSR